MPRIEWSPELSVGDAELDRQHKRLIAMIHDLEESLGSGSAEVAPILEQMKAYVETHFRHEERRLKDVDYPDLWAHKKQHIAFIKKMLELRTSLKRGESDAAENLLAYLSSWLVEHIGVEDQRYAPSLAPK